MHTALANQPNQGPDGPTTTSHSLSPSQPGPQSVPPPQSVAGPAGQLPMAHSPLALQFLSGAGVAIQPPVSPSCWQGPDDPISVGQPDPQICALGF